MKEMTVTNVLLAVIGNDFLLYSIALKVYTFANEKKKNPTKKHKKTMLCFYRMDVLL